MNRKNRILLLELTKTDFKLRYQGSILGYLWAIIRPLLLFGILYLVFAKFLRFGSDIPHYPVYLLVGTVLWNFFIECTNQGIQSLLIRSDLMRKIAFPKWIIVLSATTTALINLGINLIVVVIFALFSGVSLSLTWLLVPFLILELYLLSIGLALLLGSINVKFRDIQSIWEVFSSALFYAVPIIYPLSMVTVYNAFYAKIIMLNPIAQVIQDIRFCLITKETETTWNLFENPVLKIVPLLLVGLIVVLGVIVFKKKSKYFAEEI
ncbi:MAG: ABC transporter permease [Candidatus Saccharibacteria bacterium]|nr:ABC transporter permease [Candidatus Saccharibacteria bacterium]